MCAPRKFALMIRPSCIAARLFVAPLLVSICAGCALFSVGIESLKSAGVTASDRQELLHKQAKDFHSIMTFGRLDAAAPFIEEELKPTLLPKLAQSFKTDKFVEHMVDDVQFADDSHAATVVLTIKVFRNTDFIVKERALTEHWKFHSGGTWGLVSYELTDRVH